ncbi:MAG TPA: phage tail protein [Sphingomicrobium sp.]
MNVNGSRFHLLFGPADWKNCLSNTEDGATLGEFWTSEPEDPRVPFLDAKSSELRLAEMLAEIPDTPGERRFSAADHRAAAADRNGSLYWIADDRERLLVRSAGSQAISTFWPREEPRPAGDRIFADQEDSVAEQLEMRSVAVSADDYLIAAVQWGSRTELLRFDLVGGGPPDRFALPDEISVDDLAAGSAGAVWVLDKPAKRLVRVDRDMRLASRPVDGDTSMFAPDGEEPSACVRDEPVAIGTSTVPEPSALSTLPDGSVVVLDAPADKPAGIFILEPDATELRLLLRLDFPAFCFAVDTSGEDLSLILGDPGGNRSRRLKIELSGPRWSAAASTDTLPLRRFGGRALVPIAGAIHYDSGPEPLWVRVMELPHRAFAANAAFLTPVFDSQEPQCLWDRVRLDACMPGGASIILEARGSDDEALLKGSTKVGWEAQPPLYLSPEGSELPLRLAQPGAKAGTGCWEVLLQGITGRYCQLRVTLKGDGRISPQIRALRLWYPRFSYVERFLPAVYRAEAPPGSFLDRFLANFEGFNTALEDRIATAETLFDPRTVPAEMIDWLAGWFDIAIDTRWDEQRRRLFLGNAAQYFAWRGTVRALQLALKLALSEKIEERDFQLDVPTVVRPGGIQIVESFRRMPNLRRFSPFAAGKAPGPREHGLDSLWSPEEGSAGLWARFTKVEGAKTASSAPFPLFPDSDSSRWTAFCQLQFGFVPGAGARERDRWRAFQTSLGIEHPADVPSASMSSDERASWDVYLGLRSRERTLWQDFLSLRYRSIERLQGAWAENWLSFADIPIPDHLPASEIAARDWLIFEGQSLPMEAGAHRFSVLLPRSRVDVSLEAEADLLARARHVVELEKPAHTRFDIRFYWAMNRIGEARLGVDTGIGQGSRAPELVPSAILGRAYVGAAFVGGPGAQSRGRRLLSC